ncbi:DNA replication/repair protein RecF [Streptococcus cameli]
MWLENLTIDKFRNYKQTKLSFHAGLNIFLGQNAQGKTNILESIYFLALTRSHRTRTDKDLLQFEENSLSVHGLVHRSIGAIPLDIELTESGRVTKVNHLKQSRLSDYIGKLNVVLFAPEDLQLVKGAPAIRRKFIDVELGQMKPVYLSDLSQYNHVLKQRNTYLKTADTIDEVFLSVLDQQLAEYGCKVMLQRIDFLQRLEQFAKEKHFDISNQAEEFSINYEPSIRFTDASTLVDNYLTELSISRKRDLFKKNTGVGPHRDDFTFYINGMKAHFGSQGQHRSLVLSVKLAEIELMKEVTTEYPILLLDDVMSELDNSRQIKLLETISKKIQTFITTTSLDHLHDLPEELKIFHVNNGQIKEATNES